jgi:hypothetical protein
VLYSDALNIINDFTLALMSIFVNVLERIINDEETEIQTSRNNARNHII